MEEKRTSPLLQEISFLVEKISISVMFDNSKRSLLSRLESLKLKINDGTSQESIDVDNSKFKGELEKILDDCSLALNLRYLENSKELFRKSLDKIVFFKKDREFFNEKLKKIDSIKVDQVKHEEIDELHWSLVTFQKTIHSIATEEKVINFIREKLSALKLENNVPQAIEALAKVIEREIDGRESKCKSERLKDDERFRESLRDVCRKSKTVLLQENQQVFVEMINEIEFAVLGLEAEKERFIELKSLVLKDLDDAKRIIVENLKVITMLTQGAKMAPWKPGVRFSRDNLSKVKGVLKAECEKFLKRSIDIIEVIRKMLGVLAERYNKIDEVPIKYHRMLHGESFVSEKDFQMLKKFYTEIIDVDTPIDKTIEFCRNLEFKDKKTKEFMGRIKGDWVTVDQKASLFDKLVEVSLAIDRLFSTIYLKNAHPEFLPIFDVDDDIADEMDQGKTIGRGSEGDVCRCEYKGVIFVTKFIDGVDSAEREINILTTVQHPQILMIYGLEFDSLDSPFTRLYLELMSLGSLINFIDGHSDELILKLQNSLFKQMASGLSVLHKLNIAHHDLKPENTLLKREKGEVILKIADFGFAKKVEKSCRCQRGTMEYAAPSMLQSSEPHNIEIDIFSLAVTVWHLYAKLTESPYYNVTDDYQNIIDEVYDDGFVVVKEEYSLRKVKESSLPIVDLYPNDDQWLYKIVSENGEAIREGKAKNTINDFIANLGDSEFDRQDYLFYDYPKEVIDSCVVKYPRQVIKEIMKSEGFSNNTSQVNSYFFSQIGSPHHKRPSLPKHIPNEVRELIEECWDKDPTKRPPADDIVKRIDTFSI